MTGTISPTRGGASAIAITALLAVVAGASPASSQLGDVSLSVDDHFPVLGSTMSLTVTGPAGSTYRLFGATAPAEIDQGPPGILFLGGALRLLASGDLANGSDTVQVSLPANPVNEGRFFYLQARVTEGPLFGLSNAVPVRLGSGPPEGARHPSAIAATSDGATLFVAHQKDGSISVIDTATAAVVADLPMGIRAGAFRHMPVHLAVDPADRHLFVLQAGSELMTVFHLPSLSISARVAIGKGAQRIAFDFSGANDRLYITNDTDETVRVFEEGPNATFTQVDTLALAGIDPRPIEVLADGTLLVAFRSSHELEKIDPTVPGGASLLRQAIASLPFDLAIANGVVHVPTFTPTPGNGAPDGVNEVIRLDVATLAELDRTLVDEGTDYVGAGASPSFYGAVGSGSGVVVLGDSTTGALAERIDLASPAPTATPQDVLFVTSGEPPVERAYVVNYFRETVRPIRLDTGPPFVVEPEIALAHSGAPRIPVHGDLRPEQDGNWFFRSVQFFKGTPQNPNPVTCLTCHPDAATDGLNQNPSGRQVPPFFDTTLTGPWGWQGQEPDLAGSIDETFHAHGIFEGEPPSNASELIFRFLEFEMIAPPSPFLEADGSLSPEAAAGQAIFDGVAQCSTCHAAPLFIPVPPDPQTLPDGVGTGLAPVNVPSLLGAWSTAPYLHDGSARTLEDVITLNVGDEHGVTSTLTPEQIDQLVAYVNSL